MENSQYIRKQLPTITISERLENSICKICDSLISAKHDVLHELFEYQDTCSRDTKITLAKRVLTWLIEPLQELHSILADLQDDTSEEFNNKLTFILLSESGTNMLTTYNKAKDTYNSWAKPK